PTQLLEIGYEQHEVTGDTSNANSLPWTPLEVERQQLFTKWTGHFEEAWWKEISLTAAKQDFTQDRLYNNGINGMPVRELEDLQTFRALLQVKSNPLFLWNVVSGVEMARHEVGSQAWIQPDDGSSESTSPSMPNGATQEEIGLFSLHTVDILKLRLAFGGRAMAHRVNWEDPRWGGATWTPQALTGNISAMYALTRNVDITSSFRTGVRAPGLSDLRGGLPYQQSVTIPSDSLVSERSFSSEIGLKATNKY
ncbi:MAG: TonB-dependent receptor, partial [Bacteroidota bacterium]